MLSNPVTAYAAYLRSKKAELFDLYKHETLEQKHVPVGAGWTWGYRMVVGGTVATGASIGEDEIRFLLDLCPLAGARSAFTIGCAFGLSVFTLALAMPDGHVFAIDNYSERSSGATDHAQAFVLKTIGERFPNVHLFVGTSPEDTTKCLADLPGDQKLSIAFIDGMHNDRAAAADYHGLKEYLDARSIVLWHNTDSTRVAFEECFDRQLFDRSCVLHTHGTMGIYFNASQHPQLEPYLRDHTMIWHDWQTHTLRLNTTLTQRERQLIHIYRKYSRPVLKLVQSIRSGAQS